LADLTLLCKPWGATLVREKLGIAFSANTAFGSEPAIPIVDKVCEDLSVTALYGGPDGHMHIQVISTMAVLLFARAMRPVRCLAVRVISKRQQRCNVAVRNKPDITARTPVAPVWTTHGNVCLTAKRGTPSTSVSTFDV
jgi:hypothetical protein